MVREGNRENDDRKEGRAPEGREHKEGPGGPPPFDLRSIAPGATVTTHKTWSTEEKLQIVLEGMAPRANISEVCHHHDISSTACYEWKWKALAGMKQGLKTAPGVPRPRSATRTPV